MRQAPGTHRGRRRPRLSPALLATMALCLAAAVLGPLAAVAAAGSSASTPSDSGGSGLITTSSNGQTLTVGTTTLVLTTATTTTSGSTTSTVASTCTTPAVGTVTSTDPTTTTTATGTSTGDTGTYPPATTTAAATTTTETSTTPNTCEVTPPTVIAAPSATPLAKRGMWVWELPATDGGSITRLIAQARRYGIHTLYVKSGDGNAMWSQFNTTLVNELHRAGLDVCAWQYVYGYHPLAEAAVGVQAVKDGADCLVIDAESQYQGKYVQAQEYMGMLRARIGSKFPVALAGFPYVDYHPTFPYSVFLGANGAQYNMPQMYWQDIGTTVDAVYSHTFEFNELYQRPIYPLGQVFDSPSASSVRRFRSVGLAYKTTGISWWDMQSAGSSQLGAVAAAAGPIRGYKAETTVASVGKGAIGDLVVLAQEHLWNTPERVTIDGDFGAATKAAVATFQAANGLTASGVITPQTWTRLLKVALPKITWTTRGKSVVAKVTATAG